MFAVFLVALLIAASGVLWQRGVVFDYSLENFLPESDPAIQAWKVFADRYEPDDAFVAVGLEVNDAFSAETLRDIQHITNSLSELEHVETVVSPTTFSTLDVSNDVITINPIIGEVIYPDSLENYRERMLASEAVGYVVNPQATAVALFVKIEQEINHYEGREVVLENIGARLAPYESEYAIHYSGFPYIRNSYANLLRFETGRYVLLSTLVVLIVLLWLFRGVRGVILPLLTVYLGVLVTVALQMLFREPIDVLSSTIAAIILVVGVADAIHLLVKYFNSLGEGLSKREAIRKMVVRLGAATFLTSLTTAIGFGTLATSPVVPMKRFGLFAGMGVMLTFIVSILLITIVLLWTPEPKSKQIDRLGRGRFDDLLLWLDGFVRRRAKAILVASAILTAAGFAGASKLHINTYINDEMGPKTEVYQNLVWFEENLTTPWQFDVLLTGQEDDFKEPVNLRQAETVARYLESRPEVRRVIVVTDFLKQLNQALHGDSAAYYRIPDERNLAAQQLLLLEMTDADMLRRFMDFDYGEVRIAALMEDIGSARMKVFRADLDAFLDETLSDNLEASLNGTITLAANIADYLVESMLVSIALAFVFISLIMAMLFRSTKLVLISLVPNAIPLILVAGVMGVAGVDVSPGTAVIFSISFGIVVDDTIHMLARLRQEIASGFSLADATQTSLLGTGKAVILTSIILFAGFGSLITSKFEGTADLGALVALSVFLALLADLLLLPALLHVLKPKLNAGAMTNAKVADNDTDA
ncbi:MAG: MMPL family transporter [Rubricoccaceae bacterium]|nr:MMPL family transporter [Rubricoccaceae bacterium]